MSFEKFIEKYFSKRERTVKHTSENKKDSELIKGIDLRIDPHIQEICKVYNSSSGSTRSVLYVLLLINILSLMAVINTRPVNWTLSRVVNQQLSINNDESKEVDATYKYKKKQLNLEYDYKNKQILLREKYQHNPDKTKISVKKRFAYAHDSIMLAYVHDTARNDKTQALMMSKSTDKINMEDNERNNLIRNRIENSQTVKVPILGNSFDVNDLAIMSGISFIILLLVVRFTLIREKNNLQIALNSITERYDDFIEDEFNTDLDKIINDKLTAEKRKNKKDSLKKDLMRAINYKRRKHHYNFLSMNEIFNMPKLDISENLFQKTKIGKLVIGHLYTFSFIIYLGVVINDLVTIKRGFKVSPPLTIGLCITSYILLNFIARFCYDCNTQKRAINKIFNSFWDEKYTYNKDKCLKENSDSTGTGNSLNIGGDIIKIFYYIFFYAFYFILVKMFYDSLFELYLNYFKKNKELKSHSSND